jgi:hypothetical protein
MLTLGLAAALLTSPARAGEVDKYLPEDTEIYSVVNIRQILGSALVKNLGGVETIKGFMQMSKEVSDALKDLGLDPLKDIDKIISAQPGSGEQDKGLSIIQGRFDLEKFRDTAAKAAKDNKDVVKVQKVKDGQGGEHTIYEVVLAEAIPGAPGNLALFVGFASKNTILVGRSKDYLVTGLKVKDETKTVLKSKAFQNMIEKLDDKQSVAMVMLAEGLKKGPLDGAPQQVKDIVNKIETASFGFTVTDGVKLEFAIGAKNAADAKDLKDEAVNGLNAAKFGLGLLKDPRLEPVMKLLDTIKISSRDKIATLKAELTGEELNKLLPGAPKDQ